MGKIVGEQEKSSYPGMGYLLWSTLCENGISVISPYF
jgi:hypothetical protein